MSPLVVSLGKVLPQLVCRPYGPLLCPISIDFMCHSIYYCSRSLFLFRPFPLTSPHPTNPSLGTQFWTSTTPSLGTVVDPLLVKVVFVDVHVSGTPFSYSLLRSAGYSGLVSLMPPSVRLLKLRLTLPSGTVHSRPLTTPD